MPSPGLVFRLGVQGGVEVFIGLFRFCTFMALTLALGFFRTVDCAFFCVAFIDFLALLDFCFMGAFFLLSPLRNSAEARKKRHATLLLGIARVELIVPPGLQILRK